MIEILKKLIWNIFVEPFVYIYAIVIYLGLNKKYNYICLSDGIGDVVWFCVYYHAFLEQYKVKKIKLIVAEWQKDIPLLFGISASEVLIYPSNKKRILCKIAKTKFFSRIIWGQIGGDDIVFRRPVRKMCNASKDSYDMLSRVQFARLGMEMDTLYKYGYFNLGKNAEITRMELENYNTKDRICEKYQIDKRTILLIPKANTRLNMPEYIWKYFAEKLSEKGYKIYTNCKNNAEQEIANTSKLVLSLKEIACVASSFGMIISSRCGLADLLYCSGANLSVIHYIVGDNEDDYQYISSSLESFEQIDERCKMFNGRIVKDYKFIANDEWKRQTENIISDIGK